MTGPVPAAFEFPMARVVIRVEPLDGSQAYEVEVFQVREPILDIELNEPEVVEDEYTIVSIQTIKSLSFSCQPVRREDGSAYDIKKVEAQS